MVITVFKLQIYQTSSQENLKVYKSVMSIQTCEPLLGLSIDVLCFFYLCYVFQLCTGYFKA